MKVLLLHEKYPPIVGGGETHVWLLAEGLAQKGHKVTVATRDPLVDASTYRNALVEVCYLPGFQEACFGGGYVEFIRGLHVLLSSREWDMIHVFNTVPMLAIGALRDSVRCPVVLTLFETKIASKRLFGMWDDFNLELAIQRNGLRNARPDAIVCGSNAYVDWALDIGADPSVISLVPFCISEDMLKEGQRVIADSREPSGVYLVPARPIRRKRLEDVVLAFSEVVSIAPESRLLLMGGGVMGDRAYRQEVVELINAQGLSEKVDWLNDCDVSDMPSIFAAVDASVLASSDDGFGIALIESMAMGVPVITSDVPGHDEAVIHGESGILAPLGDVESLSKEMYRVVWDRVLRDKLIIGGRRRVEEKFSQSKMVEDMIGIYSSLGDR